MLKLPLLPKQNSTPSLSKETANAIKWLNLNFRTNCTNIQLAINIFSQKLAIYRYLAEYVPNDFSYSSRHSCSLRAAYLTVKNVS